MKSCESTGKTIEKAIENALLELNASREDVDIKILEEGGLFKKAKVLVTISDDCSEKYNKKQVEVSDDDDLELDVKSMFKDILSDEKQAEKEEKKIVKEIEKEEKKAEKEEIKKEKKLSQKISGTDFVKGLFEILANNFDVFKEEDEERILVKVEGGNSGDLIGYRGECLNAIQYIASVVENEFSGKRKRFVLDIENYRARREETLKALARRMESKVGKTGHAIKLEPMTANERRIIHTELQSSETVTTTSKGTEPNRYVVVLPKNSEIQEENE
ncbi:MAG: RNA-binding cell elongation regulator Jag/EloR [Eubacteriales bacterium]|nr:RNA-binding cell elongation regulator Jag/EloR [Eubacteriales bacterium]